ncbi:pentapeptide repeat-containing protein [Frankia sp. Cppng1_Ct_nod]|uniref:pentapeptide repeat-containing protein n=1 Tax=Frankia sp. Cppng1_Ct_nod TaxID=2897162 RepID=UPI0010419832|nr:pentapeptide repeat-containing protein [Frankia sp. Cppng1_Ct_nod]
MGTEATGPRPAVQELERRIADIQERVNLLAAESDSLRRDDDAFSPAGQMVWKDINVRWKAVNNEYEEALALYETEIDRPPHDHPLVSFLNTVGVEGWNTWRRQESIYLELSGVYLTGSYKGIDLSGADLTGAKLHLADLTGADLREAKLMGANLRRAKLTGANLAGANLSGADFHDADLRDADLTRVSATPSDFTRANLTGAALVSAELIGASFRDADLTATDLTEANFCTADMDNAVMRRAAAPRVDFTGANLSGVCLADAVLRGGSLALARLVDMDLSGADISGCRVYGSTVWKTRLTGTMQQDLVITPADEESALTVDNIDVAQFMYLLLNNERLRDVIDTVTSKVVLILGRFSADRKPVLDSLRTELRRHDYLPVLFDFAQPSRRDSTETVSVLAHLARFIVADLTDPSSVPHELATIIPQCIVPVRPLLAGSNFPDLSDSSPNAAYGMFIDLQRRYHWVLPILHYENQDTLLATLDSSVIRPAEDKARELDLPR